jgi:Amt family ammonium transporter
MIVEKQLPDVAWMLMCAALVMLMQAGFCCLESGLARSKNSINVAVKNFVDFCISSAIFWLFGYAIMFGASQFGLFGTSGFFFSDQSTPWLTGFFLFQLVFCGTATTIVSGAIAERMRFGAYLLTAAIISGVIYPVIGHWAWNGADSGLPQGWLGRLGFLDFAGSTVVHSVGGWVALAAVLVVGPRRGRFGPAGKAMHGHDLPLSTLGAFLLWFGWFGFNGGSTLGLSDRIPIILVNTNLAAAFGGLAALALSWKQLGRADAGMLINGALGGLVGITASANVMTPLAAVAIGTIAGLLCVASANLLEKWEIDDVVGAIPVHGCCGLWGTLAVALFADPKEWGTGLSRWEQLGAQTAGAAACFAWAFGLSYAILWLLNRWMRLRVDAEAEQLGLNVSEHGANTEWFDLLREMDQQQADGDFSQRVTVEPHTEVGQIAAEYNRVLDRVNLEIGKQRAAEQAAREAEKRYYGIFENSVEGMFVTSAAGQYLAANPALAQIYGYDSPQDLIVGMRDIKDQLYVQPNRRREFIELIERQGYVSEFESEVYRKDGRIIWISENSRVVRDERGEVQHYEGTTIDITGRRQAEIDLAVMHRELLDAARRAGMAEIATGVLHNVGNVLNSINVSASLVTERLRRSKIADLARATDMLTEHGDALGKFLSEDPKGRQLPGFLSLLAQHLEKERGGVLGELETLTKNIDHVKTIVSMQQSYAGVCGVEEPVCLAELMDDALQLNWSSFDKYGIEVVREYEDLPEINVEKQKLLQILVNLVKNAKDAIAQGECTKPRILLKIYRADEDRVRMEVTDNGTGIATDNLTRIFSHGFTTKPDGHGFGLHSSANTAQGLGGSLTAQSAGPGTGATFVVELPFAAVEVLV